MRILLDSNVIISAFATRGLCQDIFEITLQSHTLITSHQIIDEVESNFKSKLTLPDDLTISILTMIKGNSESIVPETVPPDACRDPNDLHILGAALAGNVNAIVTGDKDLLILEEFHSIPILTPRQFWENLSS